MMLASKIKKNYPVEARRKAYWEMYLAGAGSGLKILFYCTGIGLLIGLAITAFAIDLSSDAKKPEDEMLNM